MAIKGIIRVNALGEFFDDTLLRHIRGKNNAEVLSILKDVDPCNLTMCHGSTLLHYAAQYGNKEFAQHLIASGATVDAQDSLKQTPLMLAVDANQPDTVELLLEAGGNIFATDSRDECALGKALSRRRTVSSDIVKALLDKVTVESLNNSRDYIQTKKFYLNCSLYHFVSLNNVEITRILLESGSPVDAKSRTDETALHKAVGQLDLENVKVLLEYKADANAKNCYGQTPVACIWDFRDRNKTLAILKLLIGAGATLVGHQFPDIPAREILVHGNREMIRAVLQCQIDLQFEGDEGKTPLHLLALNMHPDILEELRGFEFDVNVRCMDECTMLHHAAKVGNLSSLRFLLDRGADVNARDHESCTPLCKLFNLNAIYELGIVKKYLDCVELLLDRGADCQIFTVENHEWGANFDGRLRPGLVELMASIFAHLAIIAARGEPIKPFMRRKLLKIGGFKAEFYSHRSQLEQLKLIDVDESVTLYDFLIASDERISMYARSKRLAPDSDSIMKGRRLSMYYEHRLKKLFTRVTRLVESRVKLANALHEILQEFYNLSVHNVAEKIVSYLEDADLYEML